MRTVLDSIASVAGHAQQPQLQKAHHGVQSPRAPILALLALGILVSPLPDLPAQPVPHQINSITVSSNKTVTLRLHGSVSNMFGLTGTTSNRFMQLFDLYPVEASTNLADWTRLAMLLRTNNDPSPLLLEETNGGNFAQRFYGTPTNHLLTAFPRPSGPSTVGTVDRVLVDPTRTNLYRYIPPTNAFMATFWYPSDPPKAGVIPAAMWDKRIAADVNLYSFIGTDTRWARVVTNLVGHRFRDVPVVAGSEKFPVIIFSHGLPSLRKVASQAAEELASHGYVIVAIDHPDCWATEFPDGRYLPSSREGDVPGRLRDMQFLLDELVAINDHDPVLADRMDLDRIGVYGGSYGGMVVETCRTDSRVKCAAIWDGVNLDLNKAGLQKPLILLLGQDNCCYSEARWLFTKATHDAVFLQIRGAAHGTRNDGPWVYEAPSRRAAALAINACLVWFFDTYLKGENPPFPGNPEIYNVQMK